MRVKLGDYIKEYSVKNKNNEDIPVYSVSNSLGFCKDYFGKEVASKNKTTYKIVPRGCFAYNPSRINVGSVDWQNEEERVIVSPLYNVFSVSPLLDQQYLLYYLKSNVTLSRIRAVASGSVRDNLKLSMLYEFPIDLISLEQQYDVVSTLNAVQKIIDLYQKELSGLDELVRARFVEMFGNVQDAKKHSDKQLKDICNTVTGGTPSTKHAEYYNGTIPWISTVSLGPNYIDGTTAKAFITQEAVDNSSTKIIPSSSILFGTRVGIGKSSINQVEMCTNQDIVAIIDLDESKYNKLYIKYVLDTYQSYFDSIKKGATILGISSDDLKNIYIPDASLYEQNRFEKFVKQIDKSRLLSNHSLFLIKSIIF